MRWRGAVFLLLLVVPGAAGAQRRIPEPGLPFSFDVASFREPGGDARTELFVSVPLTSLNFEARGGGPARTRVRITAIFYDSEDRQITGDDWSYHDLPGSAAREENDGKILARSYTFRLPAGKTRLKVGVEEPDTGSREERSLEFEVLRFEEAGLGASDLVFGVCRDLVVSAPAGGFVGPVLPHPSRRYGDDTPSICVYAEIYDDREASGPLDVRYRVRDAGGRTFEDTTFAVTAAGESTELLLRPRFTGLSLGRYELDVVVEHGGEKVKRKGVFDIDETRIAFIRDAEKLRTVLGYVATNEELRALDEASDDSLGALWTRFWERRDPTPDTRHNEAMLEFMRRVEYATQNFGVLEPGWRSDRGRIHIKYGPPDQIERILNDAYRPPTEIWYYYGRNLTYVFQDLDGFGRYRLAGSRRD